MIATRRRWILPGAIFVAAAAIVGACKPWTVRPIEDRAAAGPSSTAAARFDAPAFIESIWSTKVEPAARSASLDLAALAAAGSAPERRSVLVKGQARVTEVDLRSRVGLAYLDAGAAPTRRIALLVGPVVRGTALRDALGFISFGDFVNQIDFAAAATELNARALRSAFEGIDPKSLEGRVITFTGAATVGGAGASTPIEIIAVTLQVGGPAR